jgi:hypothetical protein
VGGVSESQIVCGHPEVGLDSLILRPSTNMENGRKEAGLVKVAHMSNLKADGTPHTLGKPSPALHQRPRGKL